MVRAEYIRAIRRSTSKAEIEELCGQAEHDIVRFSAEAMHQIRRAAEQRLNTPVCEL